MVQNGPTLFMTPACGRDESVYVIKCTVNSAIGLVEIDQLGDIDEFRARRLPNEPIKALECFFHDRRLVLRHCHNDVELVEDVLHLSEELESACKIVIPGVSGELYIVVLRIFASHEATK